MTNSLQAQENQFPYVVNIYFSQKKCMKQIQIKTSNMFFFQISLQQVSELQSPTRGHKCGGALVTHQHVLTTASCTFYNNSGLVLFIYRKHLS